MISDRAAANSSPNAKARYVARGSATIVRDGND